MTLVKRLWNRLGTRLTVLFLALALLPLFAVGYLAYKNGRQTIEQQQFDHLDTVNALKADELDRWVRDNVERLGALAQRPRVQGLTIALADRAEYQLAIDDLLANHLRPALTEEDGYHEMFLLRASDGLILASTNEAERGEFRENEAYFTEGKRGPTVQNVYYERSRGEPTMTISVPVPDGEGNVVAVLAGHVNLEELEEITYQTNEQTNTEDTYLVNSFNFFVTDPRFGEAYALKQTTHTSGVQQCLGQQSGRGFYTDYRGEPVLGAYRWLPEREMCMLTEIDQAEAFGPIISLRDTLISLGTMVALGVVAAGLFFTRSITRPLRQLTRGAKRIGQGDLEHQIDVESSDEIGQLASAFNEMADNLRLSLGETAHGRRLLLALSDAAHAVQRPQTQQEIYETVGAEVARLGFNATVLLLTEDQKSARVAYLGYDSSLIRVGEKLAGVSAADYEFPLPAGGTYRRAIEEGETLFIERAREFIAEALPAPAQRVAGRLATLLGMEQSIVAPLMVDGETLGLLTVSGDGLAEADAMAVKAFANQTAIALKNAHLYEEIRASETRFRTIFESAGAGIAHLDLAGRIVESNAMLEEMLGYGGDELRQMPFAELSHPDDAAADRELYPSLVAGEREAYQVEKRYMHKEGRPVWAQVTVSLVRDGDGKRQFAIALVDDVTERKQIEQERREQQAFLESIYTGVDLSIFVADVTEEGEFRYTGLNLAHERQSGMKLAEIEGKTPHDLVPYIPPEAAEAIRDNYARCVEAGEAIEYEEMIPMGGRETWWLTRLSPIRDAGGRIYRVVGTSLSITERKRIEEALRRHEEHLEELVEERTRELQESQSRFRTLFSAVPIPVVLTDAASGEILEANEHVARTLSLAPEKIVGSDVKVLYQDAGERGPRVQQILEKGHMRNHELTIRRGDGKLASLLLSTSSIEYDGRPALLSSLVDLTERKEMEEALRHSEERFRALVQNANDTVTVIDGEGRVQYDSPSIERVLGYRPDERLGMNIFEYAHPDDAPAAMRAFEQLLVEPQKTVTLDARVRHRDGSWRTVEVTAGNLLDDPAVQGIVVNFHDVTDRVRAEETLREHEAAQSALLNAIPDSLFLIEPDGTLVVANETFANRFGREQKKLIGIDAFGLLPPEIAAGRRRHVEEIVRTGQPARFEDERYGRHIDNFIYPVFDDNGRVTHLTVYGRDITERKLAEAELQAIFKAMPDAVLVLSGEGEYLKVAPNKSDLLYRLPESLVGQKVTSVFPAEETAFFLQQIQEVLETETVVNVEYPLTIDGVELWFLASIAPLSKNAVVWVARDITQRKQAEKELQRSNEELQQFAYVASHDLQEPLRMVSSFLQLLQQRYGGELDERADEYIYYAVDGAARMKRLINDLLEYSRVATRGKPLVPVSSQEIFDEMLTDLQVIIQEQAATITHEPLPMIKGDRTQLRQLLQNLVSNAIKFHGDDPPRIHISAERDNGMWRFAVRDEGVGIEPRHAERIFVIFQRLHSKKEYVGTGIGLAICKKIVERHGGTMWVKSEAGAGSTFYFTLPAAGERVIDNVNEIDNADENDDVNDNDIVNDNDNEHETNENGREAT